MATAAEDIADKLQALGLGTVGTSIFIGRFPERPDIAMCVAETGGQAPEFGFGMPGLKYEFPTLQISSRGAREDYEGPRTRAQTAYEGLPAVQATTLGANYYHMIRPMQAPFEMRRDDNGRVIHAFNVRVEKEA